MLNFLSQTVKHPVRVALFTDGIVQSIKPK